MSFWHPPPPPPRPHVDMLAPLLFPELFGLDREPKKASPRKTLAERKASLDRVIVSLHANPRYAVVVFSLVMLFLSAKLLTVMGVVHAYAIPAGLAVAFLAGVWAKRFLSTPHGLLIRNTMLYSVPFVVGMSLTALLFDSPDESALKMIICCIGGGLLAFGPSKSFSAARAKSRTR